MMTGVLTPLRLYDTAQRKVVDFNPKPEVTFYLCGITPYDATHLGHAATYVIYDVLERRLQQRGHTTRLVRNITDVDDDILRAARRRGVHHLDLAFGGVRQFDVDMEALGNLAPWREPRATGAIPEIRGLIHKLLDKQAAYVVDGTVFFDVSSAPDFGKLSGLSSDAMVRIGAERGEEPGDPRKRNPLDSVLWVPSGADEPAWDAPWGRGRPGWHVECSALALRYLGSPVDLHGGGTDLIYPHHECSAAQVEAATGQPLADHWMHQAMVVHEGEKMSKSLGNLVFVADLLRCHDPMALRLLLLSHHYRRSWSWDPRLLTTADDRLKRWRAAKNNTESPTLVGQIGALLDDDLDAPGALAVIDQAVTQGQGAKTAAACLGVVL
jgi:L-cysteine:1D-myo-inositol 2-amino-2-deoxy-alpha-D-glucopyranoside ligase